MRTTGGFSPTIINCILTCLEGLFTCRLHVFNNTGEAVEDNAALCPPSRLAVDVMSHVSRRLAAIRASGSLCACVNRGAPAPAKISELPINPAQCWCVAVLLCLRVRPAFAGRSSAVEACALQVERRQIHPEKLPPEEFCVCGFIRVIIGEL